MSPTPKIGHTPSEQRLFEIGQRLLKTERKHGKTTRHRWLKWVFARIAANDNFRTQALRFIDVMPTLTDNSALIDHLQEYFNIHDLNLSRVLNWKISRYPATQAFIAKVTRKLMAQVSHYYLGGTNATEAFKTILRLRQDRIGSSLDLLGEGVVSELEADQYQKKYLQIIEILAPQAIKLTSQPLIDEIGGRAGPQLYLSLKVSSLYSQLDPLAYKLSFERVAERLRPIFLAARKHNTAICLDMEQYEYKDLILHCFKKLLMEPEFADWSDVGIAIQAYLKDSHTDVDDLIEWAKKRKTSITVRLVRGAYWDYETVVAKQQGWAVPVWEHKSQTDQNYENCLIKLIDNHKHVRTAVATHNLRSIAVAMAFAEQIDLDKDRFEFQMLYGMAEHLQRVIPEQGYCLRIYVPFGEALPAMAYLVRRLLENSTSQSFQRLTLSQPLSDEELLAPAIQPNHSVALAKTDAETTNSIAYIKLFRNEPIFRFTARNQRNLYAEAIEAFKNQPSQTYPPVINGEAVGTEKSIESINPARPEHIIGKVLMADCEHANLAIKGAELAFETWSDWTVEKRAKILFKAADLLHQRRSQFACFEIFEAGKTWREADANITEAIDFLRFYAFEAIRLWQRKRWDVPGEVNFVWYRPRGIGVIIPPWNFPLAILTGMLSAAIVTGNSVILKPSSQTPVIAAKLVELLTQAGLPPGVVQFLPGSGGELGEYLVQHPRIHFIAFTGSREVGTRIIRLASETAPGQHHIKKVIAEMGGKNAIIVDQDADLDEAVPGILKSAFGYQGQKCSACSRVIAVGKHCQLLQDRLVEGARSLLIGYPEQPDVAIGPVISYQAKQKIESIIEKGRQQAELIFQSNCSKMKSGFFIAPTLFNKVPADSILAQHEIFGPVLSIMNADDIDEACKIANNTDYALTGGLYSRSPANIEKVSRQFQVGNLYINRTITGALVNRQPFGGFKLSGMGSKAGGSDYLLQFVNPCAYTENTLRRGFAPEFSTPSR